MAESESPRKCFNFNKFGKCNFKHGTKAGTGFFKKADHHLAKAWAQRVYDGEQRIYGDK